jgi:hypothetical protein
VLAVREMKHQHRTARPFVLARCSSVQREQDYNSAAVRSGAQAEARQCAPESRRRGISRVDVPHIGVTPGCGGGSNAGNGGIPDPGTTAGSYTVTVNATAGSYTSSVTVPVTVQ